MSRDTRNAGFALALSILIVSAAAVLPSYLGYVL